jgi:hypothetical protein
MDLQPHSDGRPFLTAEWRHLLMLNYTVDPALLRAHVPAGTELDEWNNTFYVSIVGFLFLRTRVRGWVIPGHRNFEEINLRFYVRRRVSGGWRRGVVFLKELVPRRAIAAVARRFYDEPYEAVPMSHRIELAQGELRAGARVQYAWAHYGRWNTLAAMVSSSLQPLVPGSEAEFITEHYWGYTARRDGGSSEYRVAHAPWRVAEVSSATLNCDVAAVYGEPYVGVLTAVPASAFIAEGSTVAVYKGTQLGARGQTQV